MDRNTRRMWRAVLRLAKGIIKALEEWIESYEDEGRPGKSHD